MLYRVIHQSSPGTCHHNWLYAASGCLQLPIARKQCEAADNPLQQPLKGPSPLLLLAVGVVAS